MADQEDPKQNAQDRLQLKTTLKRINWRNLLIVFVLCAVLSFPVYYTRITQPVEGDFGSHVRHAEEFLTDGFFQPIPRSTTVAIHDDRHLQTGGRSFWFVR